MSDAETVDPNIKPAYEVVLGIRSPTRVTEEELEATTNAIMAALHRDAAFVALGPVASIDFANDGIEVLCTVVSDSPEALDSNITRLSGVLIDAANAFEYQGATTQELATA